MKDGAAGKKFPSSMAATWLAVRSHWLQSSGQIAPSTPALSVEDFLEQSDFEECYRAILKRYRGVPRPAHDVTAQLYDLPRQATSLDYYKLRALAKFTRIRSAAAILMFTQLAGEELRAKEDRRSAREACEQLLDAFQRVIDETKRHLERTDEPNFLFWKEYDEGLLPSMDLLTAWRDAFLDGPLPEEPGGPPRDN